MLKTWFTTPTARSITAVVVVAAIGLVPVPAMAAPAGPRLVFREVTSTPQYRVHRHYTSNPDGSSKQRLQVSGGGIHPQQAYENLRFSPDGRKIAFLAGAQLWVADATGKNARRLLEESPAEYTWIYSLAWGPRSDVLYFGLISRPGVNGEERLWRINVDGTGVRKVFSRPVPRASDRQPAISVEGKIAFIRGSSLTVYDPKAGKSESIISGAMAPAWSPDGRRIAVAQYNPDGPAGGRYAIFLWDVATRTRVLLNEDMIGAQFPQWSPDGHHVAYVLNNASRQQVMTHAVASPGGPGTALKRPEEVSTDDPSWTSASPR